MYGVVSGLGTFSMYVIVPALVTRIFKKRCVTAMGIVLSGIPVAALVYPVVTKFLLDFYGLKGALLLIGGIGLHGILGSLLLVEYSGNECTTVDRNRNEIEVPNDVRNDQADNPVKSLLKEENTTSKRHETSEYTKRAAGNDLIACQNSLLSGSQNSPPDIIHKQADTNTFVILRKRGFHVSNLTTCVSYFVTFIIYLVMVDYGKNKGVPYSKSVLFLPVFSAGQILGRLLLGWFVDRNVIPKTAYLCLSHVSVGLLCFVVAHVSDFQILNVITILCGILLGNMIPTANVLYSDYLLKKEVVTAMAITRTCIGIISALRSTVIGALCEEDGSYDNLFYLIGGANLFCSVIMLVQYLDEKCSRRRQEKARKISTNSESLE